MHITILITYDFNIYLACYIFLLNNLVILRKLIIVSFYFGLYPRINRDFRYIKGMSVQPFLNFTKKISENSKKIKI